MQSCYVVVQCSANKHLKSDTKQFAVFRTSTILANYFAPLKWALDAQPFLVYLFMVLGNLTSLMLVEISVQALSI